MAQQILQLQYKFVETFSSCIQSESLREAFLRIPRDRFVSSFYESMPRSGKQQSAWVHLQRSAVDEETWLNKIYQNTWLITRLDDRGFPVSSSSQPSIMAKMLETLAIKPGHRVLEIGTGTGYNAALIACLTGDPQLVTTIDIDETVLPEARRAIASCVGEGMVVLAGNGLLGVPERAPYDRIIATGSFAHVPYPWIEQLAPDGLILLNMKSTLANSMVLLTRQEDGTATGMILPYNATFMELQNEGDTYQEPPVPLGPVKQIVIEHLPEASFYPAALQDREFTFFLQCHFPKMKTYRIWQKDRLFLYLADFESQHLVQFVDGSVRGSDHLWKQLQDLEQEWDGCGKPSRQQFQLHIEHGEQRMTLKDRSWCIA